MMPIINSDSISCINPKPVFGNFTIEVLITGNKIMAITTESPAFTNTGTTLALKNGSIWKIILILIRIR
jgi:hypothetical protein